MDVTFTVDPGPIAPFGEATMNGPKDFNPAIARSFLYIYPGEPYSPQAIEDARNTIRQIPAVGGVRITEGTTLDAYGRLPYTVDVEDRLPYAVGASAKYSTTNGPAGQVYWEDRNVFGGAERLRLQADVFYAPPWYVTSQDIRSYSIDDIGWRFSASFLKPALWGTPNDLFVDALGERMSTSGAGFFGYEVEDADATAALRHRFGQNFWVQAGIEAQTGVATDALGRVNYTLVGVPVSANYDTTDSKLDPTRGVRLNASVAGFPTALGSTVDLVQGKARASAYYSLDPDSRFVLAGLVGLGAMGGADLADIPANWRFYAGGGGSVRGYAYDELGPTGPFGRGDRRAKPVPGVGGIAGEGDRHDRDRAVLRRGQRLRDQLPEFQRAARDGGRRRPALLHRDRADPRRCRLSTRPPSRHGPGGDLRQHRAGFLMMWRLLPYRLIALIVALIALCGQARATEADKGVLADLLSRALSSETTSVSIGAVDGVLSSDASISDIVLSDRNGPWLKIDKVRLIWNRLALFSRRLEVDRLTIGHMQFLRRPACRRKRPAARYGSGLDPARASGQGDRQAVRRAGAVARRAGRRRRGAPRRSTARRHWGRRPRASISA